MEALLFLTEVFAFAVALCGLHALRPRLGLAPTYLAIGFFQTMLFVADKGATPISIEVLGAPPAYIGYATFLPLLLSSVVLVYVLEGTAAARRLLLAIVALHVLHGAFDVLLSHHASHPPPGRPWQGDSVLTEYSLWVRLVSLAAFVVDFVVILVGYQFLVNRLRRLPILVPIYLALLAAMVTDALVFSSLYGLVGSLRSTQLIEKLQVAAVAALPVATYIHLRLRTQSDSMRRGVVERNPFEVLELRKRVQEAEARLAATEQRYQTMRECFSRYVSSEAVESLLADPENLALGGKEREVTVLFADIQGYASLAERVDPREVITVLNRYFAAMSKAVHHHEGMLVSQAGDGVMAAFGAPVEQPDHADRAVRTALAMHEAIDELNRGWRRDGTLERWTLFGHERLAIRVGIHSGPVVAGNVGSDSRIEYTLIGDTVHIASRVEALNKRFGSAILVTHDTAEQLTEPVLIERLQDLGNHGVRGRVERVHVHSVVRERSTRGA